MSPRESDLLGQLGAAAAAAGLSPSPDQIQRLGRYLETLVVWRRRLALVSQKTPGEIIAKHVRDSMEAVALVRGAGRLADLGSGGGFPGMVLAILCEETEVVLVESQRRKASFLREAIRQTATVNARVAEVRAEDLAGEEAPFDIATSRAVWPGLEFLAVAHPLLRPGGLAIAMKTPNEAPAAAPPPGYESLDLHFYELEGGEARVLLSARRTSSVPRET